MYIKYIHEAILQTGDLRPSERHGFPILNIHRFVDLSKWILFEN